MLRRDPGNPILRETLVHHWKISLSEQEEVFGCLVKPVALILLWVSDTAAVLWHKAACPMQGWGEGGAAAAQPCPQTLLKQKHTAHDGERVVWRKVGLLFLYLPCPLDTPTNPVPCSGELQPLAE